jgi:hypothetical protein
MRPTLLSIVFASLLPACAMAQTLKRPVVLELFTSQGCSSCPPADRLVAELARTRPDLLPLTFHVTYWNNLGWEDPFSFSAATDRQRDYVGRSISPEAYTPALVVDGLHDVVGSDTVAVQAVLATAEAQAQTTAPVELKRDGTGLKIIIGAGEGKGQVLLLGFDREHQTQVGSGENGGRTLIEANIVRSMSVTGTWTGEQMHVNASLPAGEDFAVMVQARNGRILGAARLQTK